MAIDNTIFLVAEVVGASWRQQTVIIPSLSPPPRQSKCKRDSSTSQLNGDNATSRRPLVDPTLTPRVKPRSIKTKKQPSLLRLSLDAELLNQSPADSAFHDNESTLSTSKSHHSSLSFTPTSTSQYHPFRSGTLGANVKTTKHKSTSRDSHTPPPLPRLHIPSDYDSYSRPNSQATTISNISYLIDSPISVIDLTDDEDKLTLKERRQRKSPLAMPDTEQLTLALKDIATATALASERETIQPIVHDSSDEDDLMWRHQLLEKSIAFSFQSKSRQEAMLALEGKKSRSLVSVHSFDDTTQDIVREKAEYDAIVSRTPKRQSSHEDKRNSFNNYRTSLKTSNDKKMATPEDALGIITENEIASTSAPFLYPSAQRFSPDTPHQLNAPSLISAPSTPNSIDSSVMDHDDYMNRLDHFIHSSH